MKDPPQYQAPPPDALYDQLKQQAQQDQISATQTQVRGDTASLMARYGSLVAISGAAPSLNIAAPSTANPSTMSMTQAAALGIGPFVGANFAALGARSAA